MVSFQVIAAYPTIGNPLHWKKKLIPLLFAQPNDI